MAGKNPRLAEISNSANGSCLESASEMVSVVKQVPDSVMLQVSALWQQNGMKDLPLIDCI